MPRPTPAPRRSAAVLALATLAVAVAGCGDTGDDAAAAAACGPDDGRTVVVAIPDFSFEPEPVAVDRCDRVVWQNDHDQAHTSTGDGQVRWSTGNLAPGQRSEPVRFEEPGAQTYLCALHPFMTGTVEVT